jgi:hypothetical protein
MAAWWMATLGWLKVAISPQAAGVFPGAWTPTFPPIFAGLAAMCLFVSHLCVWERLTIASHPMPRLEALGAFWRGLGWAVAAQAQAAVFSLAFWFVVLLTATYLGLGWSVIANYQEPAWGGYFVGPKRPRLELLFLALPGMIGQAWTDWAMLRQQLETRISLLALEISRERGLETGKLQARRRIAGGLGE